MTLRNGTFSIVFFSLFSPENFCLIINSSVSQLLCALSFVVGIVCATRPTATGIENYNYYKNSLAKKSQLIVSIEVVIFGCRLECELENCKNV